MFNRLMITFLFIGLLVNTVVFADQSKKNIKQVGFLAGQISMFLSNAVPGHLQGFGFYEHKNIGYQKKAAVSSDELPQLAAELVASGVDIIVADGDDAAIAAQQATQSIPIVMVAFNDPVKSGLVDSLEQPGGNITGIMVPTDEVIAKQFELLREFAPDLQRVGVFWNPANPVNATTWEVAQAIATTQGINLVSLEISAEADPEPVLEAALTANCQALLGIDDRGLMQHKTLINDVAIAHRIPVIYPHNIYIHRHGYGLISYAADFLDLRSGAAVFVDKILKGAKPGDLPVERLSRFELYVNRKTANTMDMEVPDHILSMANRVID